jgi:hypothetical protein
MSESRTTKRGSFVTYVHDDESIKRQIRTIIGSAGEYDIDYHVNGNLVVFEATSKPRS